MEGSISGGFLERARHGVIGIRVQIAAQHVRGDRPIRRTAQIQHMPIRNAAFPLLDALVAVESGGFSHRALASEVVNEEVNWCLFHIEPYYLLEFLALQVFLVLRREIGADRFGA